MAFTAAQRRSAARQFVRKAFRESGDTATLDVDEVLAAIDATEAWVDANAASFNTALPQPFKGTATTAQKAIVLSAVALVKTGVI